jgi:hypothetical protein
MSIKVKDLIDLLQRMRDPEAEVVIHVDPGYGAVGPAPVVKVTGASGGFDWDSGRVFIDTTEKLYTNIDEIRKEAGKLQKILGWYVSTKSGGACGMDTKGFNRIVKQMMDDIVKEKKLEWLCEPLPKRTKGTP